MRVDLTEYAGEGRAMLETELSPMGMLDEVVRWLAGRSGRIAEVIVQDEFTHDVVAEVGGGWLVFDST